MSKNVKLWLRWSTLFSLLHLCVILAIWGFDPPIADKVLWQSIKGGESVYIDMPIALSRFFDILLWPIIIGLVVWIRSKVDGLDDIIAGLGAGLVFGLGFLWQKLSLKENMRKFWKYMIVEE